MTQRDGSVGPVLKLKRIVGRWLQSATHANVVSRSDVLKHLVSPSHVLEHYVQAPPSPQHAVDLFKGMWSSKFPPDTPAISGGEALAFEDERLIRGIRALGGLSGKTVLELGPLDGGHSYMAEQAGAASVISIEANTRAYLRCLVTKEILQLRNVRFQLGDFLAYLRTTTDQYDVCLASGVLYHMATPPELIALVAKHARAMYCWTHYYDDALMRASAAASQQVRPPERKLYDGFEYDAYEHRYGAVRRAPAFCGSAAPRSAWMRRDDIQRCCAFFGFTTFEPVIELPDHVHGPSFAFVATR